MDFSKLCLVRAMVLVIMLAIGVAQSAGVARAAAAEKDQASSGSKADGSGAASAPAPAKAVVPAGAPSRVVLSEPSAAKISASPPPPPAPAASQQRPSDSPSRPSASPEPLPDGSATPIAVKSADNPAAASEKLSPIPTAENADPPTVEAASFKGVTPGVSTIEDAQKAWGAPRQSSKQGGVVTHWYRVEPFERVEVTFFKDKVTSIVIRLERAFPAHAVAQQLQLSAIRPVLVSNALGEILGQAFPERGVLFAFEPAGAGSKPTMKVSQIILEPISAEPFVLRAETNLEGRADVCLRDLDQAIKLSPGNARAHWLRARILMASDELAQAKAAADEAVRLDPDDARFRVTRAQIFGQAGRFGEAIEEAEKAAAQSDNRPHIKARALCLLGDLAGSGAKPDYKRALQHHTEAIKVADPLAADPHPAIRLPAKEVLIDAHLGAAHDIAWGAWKQKDVAVDKWLQRAADFADDLARNDGGTAEHRFRVATRALAAYVGVQGKLDPAEWTQNALTIGEQLIAAANDPVQKQQIQWDLGMALYDTVQLYQMRKEHDKALEFGERAVAFLEQGAARRPDNPTDSYFLGRLYFRLGAIHAIGESKDHQAAIPWFDKAVPVLEKSVARVEAMEKGRLGETLVSMGVSYWETGNRDKGMDLTSRGVALMEEATREGTLDKAALEVPYSNLATMYRQLGKPDEARKYVEKASKNTETLRR